MIDIHCHLTFTQYDTDRENVIAASKRSLSGVVISGVEPADAKKAVALASVHRGFIFLTLGLHPIHVEEQSDHDLEAYAEYISEHKRELVGIGEIGLDYYWIRDPLKVKRMQEVFVELLGLAKELRLPAVLHLRGTGSEAIEEGLKIVRDEDVRHAVFHCFTGKLQVAELIAEEGYYISLPTSIVKSKSMKKVAKRIPLAHLLTETDAPYLSPDETERNEPPKVAVVYEEIAQQQKLDVKTVEAEIERNFETVFGVSVH